MRRPKWRWVYVLDGLTETGERKTLRAGFAGESPYTADQVTELIKQAEKMFAEEHPCGVLGDGEWVKERVTE